MLSTDKPVRLRMLFLVPRRRVISASIAPAKLSCRYFQGSTIINRPTSATRWSHVLQAAPQWLVRPRGIQGQMLPPWTSLSPIGHLSHSHQSRLGLLHCRPRPTSAIIFQVRAPLQLQQSQMLRRLRKRRDLSLRLCRGRST